MFKHVCVGAGVCVCVGGSPDFEKFTGLFSQIIMFEAWRMRQKIG